MFHATIHRIMLSLVSSYLRKGLYTSVTDPKPKMKRINKVLISGLIAFSLLNPIPAFTETPKEKIAWHVDERFDTFYSYVEEHKTNPIDMIKEAFKDHNTVCVGEMHDEPHREFAIKYLKDLKGVFEYFGVEVSCDYNNKEGLLDYAKYDREKPGVEGQLGEKAMIKAAIGAGFKVVALDSHLDQRLNNKPRDEMIKDNIKKFEGKKIMVWHGAHHVAKYDRGLENVPFLRMLKNENLDPYSIMLFTPSNTERLSKLILFYSKFRNETFALKDLDKIPEEDYNYNMHVKEITMCFDAFIHYVPENMKQLKDDS